MRLTEPFLKLLATKHISGKNVKEFGVTHKNIFEILPIEIKNSYLMSAICADWELTIGTNHDMITSQKYIEKQLEGILESVEDQGQEYWKWSTWNRGYQKEHMKVNQTVHRMNAENEASLLKGGEIIHGEQELASATTSTALGKSIVGEPGRMETLLLAHQIEKFATVLEEFV